MIETLFRRFGIKDAGPRGLKSAKAHFARISEGLFSLIGCLVSSANKRRSFSFWIVNMSASRPRTCRFIFFVILKWRLT